MKKLLIILFCLPMTGFGQEKTFESFNSKDSCPKLVYASYTEFDETYYLASSIAYEWELQNFTDSLWYPIDTNQYLINLTSDTLITTTMV